MLIILIILIYALYNNLFSYILCMQYLMIHYSSPMELDKIEQLSFNHFIILSFIIILIIYSSD